LTQGSFFFDHFLKLQADHLEDLLRPALNLFEKVENFAHIDRDFRGASPFVEVSLGNPLVSEKRLPCHPPEEFTQNLSHHP
jgi:hypothetical protein